MTVRPEVVDLIVLNRCGTQFGDVSEWTVNGNRLTDVGVALVESATNEEWDAAECLHRLDVELSERLGQ